MTDVLDRLTMTRSFDAPREQVWEAWTTPEILARWWWPARFGTTYQVDLRVGGRYSFRTADLPNMGVLAVSGTYLEIRRPERLVYTWQWENQDEPATCVTVEFLDRGDTTELHITHQGFAGEGDCNNHTIGWNDCLDRLQEMLVRNSYSNRQLN